MICHFESEVDLSNLCHGVNCVAFRDSAILVVARQGVSNICRIPHKKSVIRSARLSLLVAAYKKRTSAKAGYALAPAPAGYALAKLESEDHAGRRLSGMRFLIKTRCDHAEVGTLVNEASVFQSNGKVFADAVISAATVDEHRSGLV